MKAVNIEPAIPERINHDVKLVVDFERRTNKITPIARRGKARSMIIIGNILTIKVSFQVIVDPISNRTSYQRPREAGLCWAAIGLPIL